jgi:hypothetical protein
MFVPAPIDRDFVPHTKRPILQRNARLFVSANAGRGRGGARVVLQIGNCATDPPGTICWQGACDPETRTAPVTLCNNSKGCTRPGGTVAC